MQAGLPWWLAPGLSIAIFAGSLELLLVPLLAAVTPLGTIALTSFLVNFRHVFYAVSFPLGVVRNPLARFYAVYALTDEAYAVTAATRPEAWTGKRLLSMQIALQLYWLSGGLLGVGLAALMPGRVEGLEFALCALFTVLALDACRSVRQLPSLLLAGLSFSAALLFAPHATLLTALSLFSALLVLRAALTGRLGPGRKEGEL